jgi:hypothetical protein
MASEAALPGDRNDPFTAPELSGRPKSQLRHATTFLRKHLPSGRCKMSPK